MARFRNRRRSAGPRVDDLFYDNPEQDNPEQDNPEKQGDERDGQGSYAPDQEDLDRDGTGPGGSGEEGDRATDGADPSYAGGGGSRRGAAGRWGRAALVAAVAGGLVYGAGTGGVGPIDLAAALDSAPTTPAPPPQTAGQTLITEATLGCVGPELVGLDDASVAEPDQVISAYAAAAPEAALADTLDVSGTGHITVTGTPQGEVKEAASRREIAKLAVPGAAWAKVTAEGPLAAGLSASQISLSLTEQERGLSTAACWAAQDDTWLIAGGAEPGRVERLVLINPTGNPVTASVEVLGAGGAVEVAGGRGIVVAPGARQVVLVDALAPGEERPVLHVSTTGGPLVAALGDRWLEGTLDRGTELTTASAPPATNLVIPAIPAPRPETADSALVRVAVPGTEEAIVQLRALTPDGPARVANDVTNVGAGAVADIDLGDLPAGTHAIEIVADTPVVAAAHVQRREAPDGVSDLAWFPAVVPSPDLVGAPLAVRGEGEFGRELSIASLEGARVEVTTVTDGTQQTRPVEISAAGNVVLALEPLTDSVWVRALEGSVSSALVTTLEDEQGLLIAGMPLPEAPVTRQVRAVSPWLP